MQFRTLDECSMIHCSSSAGNCSSPRCTAGRCAAQISLRATREATVRSLFDWYARVIPCTRPEPHMSRSFCPSSRVKFWNTTVIYNLFKGLDTIDPTVLRLFMNFAMSTESALSKMIAMWESRPSATARRHHCESPWKDSADTFIPTRWYDSAPVNPCLPLNPSDHIFISKLIKNSWQFLEINWVTDWCVVCVRVRVETTNVDSCMHTRNSCSTLLYIFIYGFHCIVNMQRSIVPSGFEITSHAVFRTFVPPMPLPETCHAEVAEGMDECRDGGGIELGRIVCPICLDAICDISTIVLCKHQFCSQCLIAWFKVRVLCPVCKQSGSYFLQGGTDGAAQCGTKMWMAGDESVVRPSKLSIASAMAEHEAVCRHLRLHAGSEEERTSKRLKTSWILPLFYIEKISVRHALAIALGWTRAAVFKAWL